ncbi:MAG: IS3 family transposase, partial [Sphaerochaetaceae bacterium]|nr:IS3 family transposase [Sphaerochaetaceae bacterium]
MKEVVENYIFDYNHNRIFQSLGWLSPIQYFESYVYSN